MKPILTLVAALALAGCAAGVDGEPSPCTSEAPAPVEPEPAPQPEPEPPPVRQLTFEGVPDEWVPVFEAAADEWEAVGASVGQVHILGVDYWRDVDGGKVWAWFSRQHRTIYVSTVHPESVDLWRSALHELGHAAGADHHEHDGVMRGVGTFYDMTTCITPADLALLGLTGVGTCPAPL